MVRDPTVILAVGSLILWLGTWVEERIAQRCHSTSSSAGEGTGAG